MPTYTYQCQGDIKHTFEVRDVRIDERDDFRTCPECGEWTKRQVDLDTPVVFKGTDWTRREGRDY